MIQTRFAMKCENCGTKVRKWDTYCPKCGMELSVSEYKPLKNKYLRGEYHEQREVPTEPYDLEGEDYSAAKYYEDTYQNEDNYSDRDYNQQNQDNNYQYNQDRDYKQDNPDKSYKKDKSYKNKPYKKKYNQNRDYQHNYNPNEYKKKKYRGYDLDEYYGTEENESSIWGTVFLLLVIALLFGFVIGIIFFSTKI